MQLALAGLGTLALLYSIGLNRIATNAAIEANASTLKAITQEQENAQRQLRAYVGIEVITTTPNEFLVDIPATDPSVAGTTANKFIHITVKNFGQTPAKDVVVYAHTVAIISTIRPHPDIFVNEDADAAFNAREIRTSTSRYILNNEQTHTTDIAIWDVGPWRAGQRGEYNIFVFGRIYYTDSFNKPWRVKFCQSWSPSQTKFIPYEHYNEEDSHKSPFA